MQKSELRSQKEDEGSKGRVDWGAVEEHREGNDVRNNALNALTKSQQRKSAVIKNSSESILMESTAFLNWQTEYCSGLHSYKLHPHTKPTQE